MFKVGDKVTLVNSYGVRFPGKTITQVVAAGNFMPGDVEPTVTWNYHIEPTDAPWYLFPESELELEDPQEGTSEGPGVASGLATGPEQPTSTPDHTAAAREKWYADYRKVRTIMRGTSFRYDNEQEYKNVWNPLFDVLYDAVHAISKPAARAHFDKLNYGCTPWRKPTHRIHMKLNMKMEKVWCDIHRRRNLVGLPEVQE